MPQSYSSQPYGYFLWTERQAKMFPMAVNITYKPLDGEILSAADTMLVGEHSRHSSDYNRLKFMYFPRPSCFPYPSLLCCFSSSIAPRVLCVFFPSPFFFTVPSSLKPELAHGSRLSAAMVLENMRKFGEFLGEKVDQVIPRTPEREAELTVSIKMVFYYLVFSVCRISFDVTSHVMQ